MASDREEDLILWGERYYRQHNSNDFALDPLPTSSGLQASTTNVRLINLNWQWFNANPTILLFTNQIQSQESLTTPDIPGSKRSQLVTGLIKW
jgi:hypothetical protein